MTAWILRPGDYLEFRGQGSLRGIFTVIYITFEDAETGLQTEVGAAHPDSEGKFGAFEKVVHAGRPRTTAEAQDIADRAIEILGGGPVTRRFVTLSADQQILRSDRETGPASAIEDLDTLRLGDAEDGQEFYVQVLSRDDVAGNIEIGLNDGKEGRFEMELELMNLERGA